MRLQAELAKQMSSAEESADLQLLVGDARNAFEAERGAQDTLTSAARDAYEVERRATEHARVTTCTDA